MSQRFSIKNTVITRNVHSFSTLLQHGIFPLADYCYNMGCHYRGFHMYPHPEHCYKTGCGLTTLLSLRMLNEV